VVKKIYIMPMDQIRQSKAGFESAGEVRSVEEIAENIDEALNMNYKHFL